jgi:hypothetical protein
LALEDTASRLRPSSKGRIMGLFRMSTTAASGLRLPLSRETPGTAYRLRGRHAKAAVPCGHRPREGTASRLRFHGIRPTGRFCKRLMENV